MSELAVNPFDAAFTTTDADIRITGTQAIEAIRVKILKHGTIADGTLTLEVFDGVRSLGSSSITASEFNSISGTYG